MEGAKASSRGTTVATLDLQKGYYRTSAKSQVVVECYLEDACVGGTDAESYCADGYEGPCECDCIFYLASLLFCFFTVARILSLAA